MFIMITWKEVVMKFLPVFFCDTKFRRVSSH